MPICFVIYLISLLGMTEKVWDVLLFIDKWYVCIQTFS